jgi:hypothetical protein
MDYLQEHLATVLALVFAAGAIYALIAGSIDFEQFAISLGAGTGGIGALGAARSIRQNGRVR